MDALRWICCLAMVATLQAQPSDMSKFSSRADVWPKEVTVKAAQPASKGQTAIPAGVTAKVVGLEGNLLGVEYQGTFSMVPVGQTDFVEKASVALAQKPNPPSRAPNQPPPAAAPSTVKHPLGDLEKELIFGDGAKIPPGSVKVASREYILLQFGGGNRWAPALEALTKAAAAAGQRRVNFQVLLVPIPGMTLPQAGALMKENGGAWPMIDPRNERLLTALWTRFGHRGSFALALVDAQARTVAATRPGQDRVEDLENVLNALNQLRP